MNPCLCDLFRITEKRERFAKGLPVAFDMVRQRMPKSNPAVGILREHVILGFLQAEFGSDEVIVPEDGTERGHDVELCGEKLSIKTRTNAGGFKVIWTADSEYAQQEINEGYNPECDILLVNIHWNMNINSVFFIPMDVQDEVIGRLGRRNYLSSATGTNNRGIEIRTSAVTNLRNHERMDWARFCGQFK